MKKVAMVLVLLSLSCPAFGATSIRGERVVPAPQAKAERLQAFWNAWHQRLNLWLAAEERAARGEGLFGHRPSREELDRRSTR